MRSTNWRQHVRSIGIVEGENKCAPFSVRVESSSEAEYGHVHFYGQILGVGFLDWIASVRKQDASRARARITLSYDDSLDDDFDERAVGGGRGLIYFGEEVIEGTTEIDLWRLTPVSVNNRGSRCGRNLEVAYDFLPNCVSDLREITDPHEVAKIMTKRWRKARARAPRWPSNQYFKWVERDEARGCPEDGWWQLTNRWDYFLLSVDKSGVVYPPYVPLIDS